MSAIFYIDKYPHTIIMDTPRYGYTVEIEMALLIKQGLSGLYSSWDNGAENDVRKSKFIHSTDETRANQLFSFFTDPVWSRDKEFSAVLVKKSGFFLFGPDLGDSDTFTVSMLEMNTSGMKYKPYRNFEFALSLLLKEFPSYSIPASSNEGYMTIGNITGLRQPQGEITHKYQSGISRTMSIGGTLSSIDIGHQTDVYESELTITAKTNKMAELVYYLTNVIRGKSFKIISSCKNYLFGIGNGQSGSYECKLTSNKLTLTHVGFNKWTLEMSVWMKAAL